MQHERGTTDLSALASLGRSAAVFLPADDGPALLVHDHGAPEAALGAMRALTCGAALGRLPAGALGGPEGFCADARPLLAGVPAPVCALARTEGGVLVLLAWGDEARRARLGAAFAALAGTVRDLAAPLPAPFEEVFENAAQCMAVIDAERRVHAANRAARRLLRDGGALEALDGRLHARDPAVDRRLGETLEAAAHRDGPGALRVPMGEAGPLLRCEFGRIDRPSARVDAPARFLMTAAPPEAAAPMGALLSERYGLTPSEARLAAALVEGLDLRSAGERLGVSRHTARKYLQIAFSKMGVRRQADLVRRAMRLAQDPAAEAGGSPRPTPPGAVTPGRAPGCAARSTR